MRGMKIQLVNEELIAELHKAARGSERLRQNFDLRTTVEDGSQRMLNVLESGTQVPIHQHLKTSESVICIEGCLDWVFYEELPNVDSGGPVDSSTSEETGPGAGCIDQGPCFKEVARFRVCPREKVYGIQVPKGAWHSIVVHEPSTIFEAKDGKYGE